VHTERISMSRVILARISQLLVLNQKWYDFYDVGAVLLKCYLLEIRAEFWSWNVLRILCRS